MIPVTVTISPRMVSLKRHTRRGVGNARCETLTARKDDIAGLAVASDERIEAYILHSKCVDQDGTAEIVSLRTLIEDGGARVLQMLSHFRGGIGTFRFPKVHPAEIAKSPRDARFPPGLWVSGLRGERAVRLTGPDLHHRETRRMPQIVIPDDEPAIMLPSMAYGKLAGRDVRAYADRPSGPDDLAARVGDAEIVINIRSTSRFTATVMEKCPQLRLISIWGTGTDNVDLAAAKARGVRVANTPGVSAIAVAEHTVALIMAVAKQLVQVDQQYGKAGGRVPW